MATFSLVPTPSALETRIGSLYFFLSSSKSAPKLPIPPSTPLVKVRVARWRIRFLASSATAMFTPASAYFIGVLALMIRFYCRATREGSPLSSQRFTALKNMEQPPPPHGSGMDDSVQVRQKAFANLPGLPCIRRRIQRH